MKLRVCLLAAAMALPTWIALPAFAESPAIDQNAQIIESIHVAGVIHVDDAGRVVQVSLRRNTLLPNIQERVLDIMRSWAFEPYLLEGEARRIRTSVHLRLDQLKSEVGYQLVFGEVQFGQPLARELKAPRYPAGSIQNRIAAEVLLRVTLDDAGDVALAEPVTARVLNPGVRNEHRHRRLVEPFVRSSVAAIEQWSFEFVEPRADGEPHQMLVPIRFSIEGMRVASGGNAPQSPPVMYDLSSPLGRPLESLAREAAGRSDGVLISPAPSPLRLREQPRDALTM